MKTLVTFKTYLGSAGQYSKWIAEKTKADLLDFSKAKNNHLQEYDTIVVVSGTYAGYMPLVRYLKKHWKILSTKNVLAVAVGAAPADDPWSLKNYQRIPEQIRSKIEYYKLPSSIEKKGRQSLNKANINPIVDYIKKI